MLLSTLTAISPIDGRYRNQTQHLDGYFSELALIKYRVHVEIEYFLALEKQGLFSISNAAKTHLQSLLEKFGEEEAFAIKEIEKTTNHDVKAVEYFIKQELDKTDAGTVAKEFIHFGLTSQDVNNTAIPLSWKHFIEHEILPGFLNLTQTLTEYARQWKNIPLLARTHGQPASPTTLGKEIMVFVERIQNQITLLNHIPFAAKFGGATGNFNAHHVAYPHINWVEFANNFVNNQLGLDRMQFTTQIEHYDNLAAHFDTIKRLNNILIDLCRDIWTYISFDYFKQKTKAGEVGSSAMPHKVNPIDFENAEGNLGLGNGTFEHLSAKLPISRLQRDLTDSTVLRNIGVPASHTIIALNSINKGLGKLVLNQAKINADLEANWAVVAEAIQTILRRENYPNPYEALKALTRGTQGINKDSMQAFINELDVNETIKAELLNISPENYIGVEFDY